VEVLLAFAVGALFAAGVYLMLRRNLLRFIFGLGLMSNAVNLLLFVSGRLASTEPPLIPEGEYTITGSYANPLPQALILTAIVIGFGLLSYALVILYRANAELGTMDADAMRAAEPLPAVAPGLEPTSTQPEVAA
jgi:multicomponent Na+:H+ antiporter subunit C